MAMHEPRWHEGAIGFRESPTPCLLYGRINGWNMACITDHKSGHKLDMWNLREHEWHLIETPPGATIDELKALAVVLLRMNN